MSSLSAWEVVGSTPGPLTLDIVAPLSRCFFEDVLPRPSATEMGPPSVGDHVPDITGPGSRFRKGCMENFYFAFTLLPSDLIG